jgi:acyl-CoA hydrolase
MSEPSATSVASCEMTQKAYLTFVAVDPQLRPRAIPPLTPRSDEEKQRWADAQARRNDRLNLLRARNEHKNKKQ